MRPLAARLTFFGFLLLAGAIAANALYMQPVPEARDGAGRTDPQAARSPDAAAPADDVDPARRSGPAEPRADPDVSPATVGQSARPAQDRTASAPPRAPRGRRPAPPAPRPAIVRAIQRELAHRDYAIEQRDGRNDTQTRLAILQYQYDTGATLTGRPSEALLESILFGPFEAASRADPVAQLEADERLVASVQGALSRLGFASLEQNGRMGSQTRDALRQFAEFVGLRPDGRLSPRVLLELIDMTEEAISPGGSRTGERF